MTLTRQDHLDYVSGPMLKIIKRLERYQLDKCDSMPPTLKTDLEKKRTETIGKLQKSLADIRRAKEETADEVRCQSKEQLRDGRASSDEFVREAQRFIDFHNSLDFADKTIGDVETFFNGLPESRRGIYDTHRNEEKDRLRNLHSKAEEAGPGTKEANELFSATMNWTRTKTAITAYEKQMKRADDVRSSDPTEEEDYSLQRSSAMTGLREMLERYGFADDEAAPKPTRSSWYNSTTSEQDMAKELLGWESDHRHLMKDKSGHFATNSQDPCTLVSEYGSYCTPGLTEPSVLGTRD